MSGPPHHPHNRQVPAANPPWNHLQVPNYFPRQPQLAHMSNEHSILHQPTWHTPTTTETLKQLPHTHLFGLGEMLPNDCFPRHTPGVDLSVARNGNQNGDLPTTPISLSVRDTNKINSLPPSVLQDIQAVELTKCSSPGSKSLSPGLKSISPGLGTSVLTPTSLVDTTKIQKRSNIRVDSILERLNPSPVVDKLVAVSEKEQCLNDKAISVDKTDKPQVSLNQSVIVQATSSHDENSNSSSILNVPTPTNFREEDTVSTYSNEDSLDSNKSRRKRKPSKTVRVSKDDEKLIENELKTIPPIENNDVVLEDSIKKEPLSPAVVKECPVSTVGKILEENKIPERRRSMDDRDLTSIPAKTRRKTSSESETIDNIAAMVQEGLKEKQLTTIPEKPKEEPVEEARSPPVTKPISVSVIKTKDNLQETLPTNESSLSNGTPMVATPAQKKVTSNTYFVEVENKLEEMFAGIEDSSDPLKTDSAVLVERSKLDEVEGEGEGFLKLDDSAPSTSQVTSTSEVKKKVRSPKKKRKTLENSRRNSEVSSVETTPQKRKTNKKGKIVLKGCGIKNNVQVAMKSKKSLNGKQPKVDAVKDIYAYDSGSNASSSRSRGPFIQIRGPRDSPISVSVVNTPTNDDDQEKKTNKTKKFHDDSEYRHKVRSKGLHCSTLSNKYDAQTRDASWICAFCKRGPHASELTGPSSNGEIIPPGDLFGPYFITTQSPEFERRFDDPHDKQFKSKKIRRALEESAAVTTTKITGKKSKRKHSDSVEAVTARLSMDCDNTDVYLGITETGNKTYEIWAHEDCIVWSPGIYLVGPKIVGLEEAVWTSCNVVCRLCNLKGANICCLKRGCANIMHLCCSRTANWQFDEVNFKAYCPLHTIP